MTMGNEGIIGKAQSAVDMYKNAQEKEEIEIAKAENEIDGYVDGNRDYATEINNLKAEIQKLKNANIYTETEKQIGTWVDGKTLYQSTIKNLNFSFSWYSQFYANASVTIPIGNAINVIALFCFSLFICFSSL